MIRTAFLSASAALLLAGCATVPTASIDQWAGFGEATRAGPVVVEPQALVEDSRCPMNARCIWAGRVVIDAKLWIDRQSYPARLALGEPYAISGGQLVLDTVEPSRTTQDFAIPPRDYRLHFDFRQN